MNEVQTLTKPVDTDTDTAHESKNHPDTMTEAHLLPNICKPVTETVAEIQKAKKPSMRDRAFAQGFNEKQLATMLTAFEDWGTKEASDNSDVAESELLEVAKWGNQLLMSFATIGTGKERDDVLTYQQHPQLHEVYIAQYTTVVNGSEQNRTQYVKFNYQKPVLKVSPKEISITTDDTDRPFVYPLSAPLNTGIPWPVLKDGHLDAAVERYVQSFIRSNQHITESSAEILVDARDLMTNTEIDAQPGYIELQVGKVTGRKFNGSTQPGLHSVGFEVINDWEKDGLYLVPYIAVTSQDGEVHKFHGEAFKGTALLGEEDGDFATIDDIEKILPEKD
jgi:hypothetical protein